MHCDETLTPLSTARQTAVALGYFDGVHLGHRAVLCGAAEAARACGEIPAVFTFSAPPGAAGKGRTLLTETEKRRRIADCGIEAYFCPPFESFHNLTPEQFVTTVLRDTLHARVVLCGDNFTFGAHKSGNVALLQTLCETQKIAVTIVPMATRGETTVSSTRIRACLEAGDLAEVNAMLGEPYTVDFPVQHGKKLGSTLGFPTLNQIYPPQMLLPKQGVYLTQTQIGDVWLPSATGLGTRPTVSGEGVTCETFIPGFTGMLYDETVRVRFLQYDKPTVKFETLEQLRAYIQAAADATLALAAQQPE